ARVPVVSTSTTTKGSVESGLSSRGSGATDGSCIMIEGRPSTVRLDPSLALGMTVSRNIQRPSAPRENLVCPAKSAAAICSATPAGAPGSWQTYEIKVEGSAGPAERKSAARSVSEVLAFPKVNPDILLTCFLAAARRTFARNSAFLVL